MREFQAYVNSYCAEASIEGTSSHSHSFTSHSPLPTGSDSGRFISSVITAIGEVATRIREVAEICLKGLITLLSNKSNQAIIAQSVIVIRTQILNRERDSLLSNRERDSLLSNRERDSLLKGDCVLSKSDDFTNASTESTVSRDSIGTVSEVTTLIIKQLVNSRLMND